MAYQVLARKWRPKTFADLVGQEHVVKALRNALDEGRLHHAYLLTGTRGVGKTTIARILAKSLNCGHAEHGEPCGVCESCTQIDAGRYVDLLEIDAASNTGIDNIREVLENAQYAPTAGRYKVYIIDEVHMLSKSAFNAMLKTLEEPPEHVKFILATTDPHKVPVTVLSRCLQFVLRNMTTQQVADHLAHVLESEKIPYEATALQLIGRAGAGSMRDALSLLDQAIAMGSGSVAEQDVRQMIGAVDKQYLYELLAGIVNRDGKALLGKAQEMAARAIGFDSALSELAMLLQRLALIQAVPSALAGDDPERENLLNFVRALSGEQIQLYYQCVIHGKQDLSLAPDEYAGFVMTLLRMLAFAPFAAEAHDTDGVIENTQLGSASTSEPTEKKPLRILPLETEAQTIRTASAGDDRPSENMAAKDEEIAESEVGLTDSVESVPTPAEPETAASQLEHERPSETVAETAVAEVEAVSQPEQPQTVQAETAATVRPSENIPAQSNEADNKQPLAKSADDAADELPPYFPEEAGLVPEAAAMSGMAGLDEEEDEADEDEQQFAALPEFKPENWAAVVQRFARKLGAAQMLAQHAAWASYDADTHLLILALADEARATTNKERLDKIRDTLADAYGLPLKLQTEPWDDGKGLETPIMCRKRLQLEGRQQAQECLEADNEVQQIMRIFEAQWQQDTLELAENKE
ncbi:DNA polymerase III subunit gamma/tau [uncultured Neisseria sp.]|uniref:DNA polymerase III subunit gamma/tau n=1 Tax=uncultured Neisseria sp. TaxID=237778 RepID=UPI00260E89F0|nr:DNA polymerase III subunit gamma/tau [uncultured Neisseria sp.]